MEQELNQKEQPTEETSAVTPTEETPTSEPRTYTEEEWRTFQSKADKQINDATIKAQNAEATLRQLNEDHNLLVKQQQELQAEIERKEDEALEGDVEALSAVKIRRQATKATRELAKKEKDIARRESALTGILREQALSEISRQYTIDPEVLKIATSYEEAEIIAKAIKQEREKLPGKVEPKTPPPHYNRGVSDIPTTSFSNIEKLYAEGHITTQEYTEARRKQNID